MRLEKDPQANLDYQWDWSGFLHPGETISTFTLVADPSDGSLTINNSATAAGGTAVVALLGGGVLGRAYDITNHVVTSAGRTEDLVLSLVIRQSTSDGGVLSACEWPVDYAGANCNLSLPASGMAVFEDMAVEFLWRGTDQQFGLCEGTIRPCRQDCYAGLSTYYGYSGFPRDPMRPFYPALIGGQWFNIGCGAGCGDSCGCSDSRSLQFEKPVYEIGGVEIDGVSLSPSAYRVDNWRMLVRQDGGLWPYCQDMNKPLGQVGTWGVTVRVGQPVPQGGRVAAGKLACEFAKAVYDSKNCELPKRVQSITRQGVSISMMLDTFDDLDKGKTGIWLVDSWVASVNRASNGFSIATPDLKTPRHTTWGG